MAEFSGSYTTSYESAIVIAYAVFELFDDKEYCDHKVGFYGPFKVTEYGVIWYIRVRVPIRLTL